MDGAGHDRRAAGGAAHDRAASWHTSETHTTLAQNVCELVAGALGTPNQDNTEGPYFVRDVFRLQVYCESASGGRQQRRRARIAVCGLLQPFAVLRRQHM